MTIGIIDYGMGNLRSVQKGFAHVGAEAMILSSPRQITTCDRVVLPGVGAFANGMSNLKSLGWSDAILSFLDSGRPFLGVCLGMQLLFEGSQEDASDREYPVLGLGILPGQVVRFEGPKFGPDKLKVPHTGWNTITWLRDDPLLTGLDQSVSVYFVHSYYAVPATDRSTVVVSACADYGGPFCCSIWHDHIWATQFHPEKSQRVGLQMLANFAGLNSPGCNSA